MQAYAVHRYWYVFQEAVPAEPLLMFITEKREGEQIERWQPQ